MTAIQYSLTVAFPNRRQRLYAVPLPGVYTNMIGLQTIGLECETHMIGLGPNDRIARPSRFLLYLLVVADAVTHPACIQRHWASPSRRSKARVCIQRKLRLSFYSQIMTT